MARNTADVICSRCRCSVVTVQNPKPQDTVRCPKCGAHDRFDVVMNKLADQAAEKLGSVFAISSAKRSQAPASSRLRRSRSRSIATSSL